MDKNIVKIADLSHYNKLGVYNVSIKASVSIKSIKHDNTEYTYFYMDLRDKSGEISAVAYEDACARLHRFMKQNKTYIITQFYVGRSDRRYTSISHEKEIVLRDETVVELCGSAAKVEWPFTMNSGKRTFFYIIGVCTGVTDTESLPGKLTRKVRLLDESRQEVTLHVWNRETKIFDNLNYDIDPVILVKDARVFRSCEDCEDDEFCVTTTRYLQLLNPDDPRACRVKAANKIGGYRYSDSDTDTDSDDSYYAF